METKTKYDITPVIYIVMMVVVFSLSLL